MTPVYPILGFAEPFSSWTHLVAALFFLALGAIALARRAQTGAHVASILVFTLTCVFLLSMSGVYHLLPHSSGARDVLCRLDHAGIYLLIAGTFTAIHNILFTGWLRWGAILAMWVLALLGLTFKSIYFHSMPEVLDLSIYLGLGWMGVFSGTALGVKYGLTFVRPLLYGGVAYTFGAVLEFFREPVLIPGIVGPHEFFHVAVIVGIGFHWLFIRQSLELDSLRFKSSSAY